jgi:iron complex outermembrane receptor protein
MHKKIFFCLLFFLLSALELIYAQHTQYQLKITCIDSSSGISISDFKVKINKLKISQSANPFGEVQLTHVKSGNYQLQIEATGYEIYQTTFQLNSNLELKFQLCPIHIHLDEAKVFTSNNQLGVSSQLHIISPKLSIEQLNKTNPLNWSQMLKAMPGVYLFQSGPVNSIPIVRGLHTNRLLLVQNGVRLYNQQWGIEHVPEIATENIDQIQLLRGPFTLKYGAEGFAGVLINTGPDYLREDGFHSKTQFAYHTNNKAFGFSEQLQFRTNKIATQLIIGFKKAADAQSPNYVISNTGFENYSCQANLLYQFSNKLSFENKLSIFDIKTGIATAAHIGSLTDLQHAIQSNRPLYMASSTYQIQKPFQTVNHQQWVSKINYQITKAQQIQTLYSIQHNHRQEFDKGVVWSTLSKSAAANDYDLVTQSLNLNYQFQSHLFQSEFGFDLVNGNNITTGTQMSFIPNYTLVNLGAYLTTKYQFKAISFESSYRIDQKHQQVFYRDLNNKVFSPINTFKGHSFALAFSFPIVEKLTSNFSFMKAWRAPAVNELYSNGLHNSLASFELGNINLQAENAFNFESGLQFKNKYSIVKLNLFFNTLLGYINSTPTGKLTVTNRGSFPSFVFEQFDARFQGLELSLLQVLGKYFQFNYQVQLLKAFQIVQQKPIYAIPPNQMKASLDYHVNYSMQKLHISYMLDWNYVAQQTDFNPLLDYLLPPSAYHLIHIGSTLKFKNNLSFQVQIRNLFNVSYRDYLNRFRYFFDEPGRNISIQVNYQF